MEEPFMKNFALTRKQLGALGESASADYLQQNGLSILERNWRCRSGEIDLIADEGDHLVFIEVRTRSSEARFGTPKESVDARKQRQVAETAQYYLLQKRQHDRQVRFDVISVMTDPSGNVQSLEHIRIAF
jgi:putative endonuclease